MDMFQMLDVTEELLNIYGYEVYRNVGVKGGAVTISELGKEPTEITSEESPGILHKLDILAEKTDIERPFGRIAVIYKRGKDKVTPADIYHLSKIMEEIGAYYGMYLTDSGFDDEAESAARNNKIEIIDQERLERLVGKASLDEPWWQGYPAFVPNITYEQSLYYFKYYFEKIMHVNWDTIFIHAHEFNWTPYWKFTYYIEKTPERKAKKMDEFEGYVGINAFTGQMDFNLFAPADEVLKVNGPAYLFSHEIINRTLVAVNKFGKVHKPKWLPKNVKFHVYKPALEKHEAKLVAQQYISKYFTVPPEDVSVTARELMYVPQWRLMIFIRPIIKNIHTDTEHFATCISAIDGEGFGYDFLSECGFYRPFWYIWLERVLYNLLGVNNYINFMRRVGWGVIRLHWSFNVRLYPWMMSMVWGLFMALLGYLSYSLTTSLPAALAAFLGINILLIPFHSFWFVYKNMLSRYPHPVYPHPTLSTRDIEAKQKKEKRSKDAEKAYESLASLKGAGKLKEKELHDFERLRKKKVDKLFDKIGA